MLPGRACPISRRALVVEDTPSARMLVTALLTQQGST